jgi:diguanylate cyclase (GGDEF)-like protein
MLCTCALAVMAASLGSGVVAQALMQYRVADRVEQAVDVSAKLLALADQLAVERPAEGDRLLAQDPANGPALAALAAVQHSTDLVFSDVKVYLAGLSYEGAQKQVAMVSDVQSRLMGLRRMADPQLALPKAQRAPNVLEYYLSGFTDMFDLLDAAQDLRDVVASQQDGVTMDLIELARQVWLIRARLGARTAPLMAVVDANAPISPDQVEVQAEFDGSIVQERATVASLLRRLASVPGLQDSGRVADEAIIAHQRLLHRVLAADRDGVTYPISALALGRSAVETGRQALTLRDAALQAARWRVAASRHEALRTAQTFGGVVVLILAATIAVLLVLHQRIVTPVLALTDVIGRLARRDYAVAIPPATQDEIGRMAGALETLRQGAIAAEQAERQIAHLARHDTLTGLANRRWFQERLDQAIAASRRGEKCALLCLDLDRFKAVNDTYGHPKGDLLLQLVARRLGECVREIDTASRFGGDEFAVLLVSLDRPESAAAVADRIVRSLSEPFDLDGVTVRVGASVGIAVAPQDATTSAALLTNADTALYRVKADERGSFRFFAPEMQLALQTRSALEQDLRDAIRDAAFSLIYEPQYRLGSNRVCGFEAVLRWQHPVRGIVGPEAFMPLAEETRLAIPLGSWALHRACADAAGWPEATRVAVNLAGAQFRHHDLVAEVREALDASGLPATRLDLEVTESVLLSSSDATLAALHALTAMGARIALDDFGTGHSSLGHLRRFAFDKIKIDRSFIRDLSPDPRSLAVIRAVVGLGRDLGMTIAAVGVETADQLSRVRGEGCTEAQGAWFSRPVSADAARQMAIRSDGIVAAAQERVRAWAGEPRAV